MPDATWGILSGVFSGVLAAVAARLLSHTERREDSLRKSYEILLSRVSQLEDREEELLRRIEAIEKERDTWERSYYRLLRDTKNGEGWKP